MDDFFFEIVSNEHVAQDYYRLTFSAGNSPVPRPGQFYQILCSSSTDPLFRRPFSVHRAMETGNSLALQVLYRVVGKGTEWLLQRKEGEKLDILGPFGNGFFIHEAPTR